MDNLKTFLTKCIPYVSAFFVFMATGRVRLYAQTETTVPSEVDINVNVDGGGTWYSAWWVWVLGIAIFLIIIVAIVSAGRK